MAKTTSEAMDVAVIGGGISGLYAATKLLDGGHHVVLFEATERLGGRILSTALPGMMAPAELGAMRFRLQHRRLAELLLSLYLKPNQLPKNRRVKDIDDVKGFGFDTLYYLAVYSGLTPMTDFICTPAKNQGHPVNW